MRLLEKIRTAEVSVGTSKTQSAWYRGHSKSKWSLSPKLFRSGHKEKFIYRAENASYADFRSSAGKYIPTNYMRDSWDYLAAMQHFGVATRLLDWTTSFDIALYFAISGVDRVYPNNPEEFPSIWVLNPYAMNRTFSSDRLIFDRADPIPYDYYQQTVACIKDNVTWAHTHPIAYNPGFTNQRIESQHGRFTIHGANMAPLGSSENPPKPDFWGLQEVRIDSNDWGELRRHSIRSAETHLRVYPDIEGYAKMLNQQMKI